MQAEKPNLMFPQKAIPFLKQAYGNAGVIFEYGSGASTIMAAELGKTVVSIESDRGWAEKITGHLQEANLAGSATIIHVDIGPTKEWGYPVDNQKWEQFPDYSFSLWHHAVQNDLQPDLILLDGRFRVGCFIASMVSVRKPTRLLFDDYTDRPHYRYVEKYFKPVEYMDRMAVFEIDRVAPASLDIREISEKLYESG